MLFTALLNQITEKPSTINISSDWMQGRAAFGGLSAALIYESMRKQLAMQVPVRCLQISFIGPVTADALTIESEILREGKSVSHISGRGVQNGETKVAVMGSFGKSRDSVIHLDCAQKPFQGSPEQANKMPYIEGVMPVFTKHFDFRYQSAFPFAGVEESVLRGYVRFAEAEPEMNEAHLLGLADAWPPTTLPILKTPAAASSLSWTIEFVHPQPALDPQGFTLYEAEIVQSANGYGHTRALIWNEAGELLAISQQTVTHFA